MAGARGQSDGDGVEEPLDQDRGGTCVQSSPPLGESEELGALVEQVGRRGVEVLGPGFAAVGRGGLAPSDEPVDLPPIADGQDEAFAEQVDDGAGTGYPSESGGEDLLVACTQMAQMFGQGGPPGGGIPGPEAAVIGQVGTEPAVDVLRSPGVRVAGGEEAGGQLVELEQPRPLDRCLVPPVRLDQRSLRVELVQVRGGRTLTAASGVEQCLVLRPVIGGSLAGGLGLAFGHRGRALARPGRGDGPSCGRAPEAVVSAARRGGTGPAATPDMSGPARATWTTGAGPSGRRATVSRCASPSPAVREVNRAAPGTVYTLEPSRRRATGSAAGSGMPRGTQCAPDRAHATTWSTATSTSPSATPADRAAHSASARTCHTCQAGRDCETFATTAAAVWPTHCPAGEGPAGDWPRWRLPMAAAIIASTAPPPPRPSCAWSCQAAR